MRLALVSPARGRLVENEELERFFASSRELTTRADIIYNWPELGLLTLAALLPSDVEVCYIDERNDGIDFDAKYDLVALTALTPKAARAYAIAREFRRRGVYVVMGGPHATACADEAARHADSVFVGEAQVLWPEFWEDFLAGRARRIYERPGTYADMRISPLPRYDLLNPDHYRIIPIETTRGCPHDCDFCASTSLWGRTFRRKPVERVLEEIRAIKRVAPRKYLFFVDDNMFVHRRYSYELLQAMIPLHVRWFTQTDISIADDDRLLELMYRAGCREVLIGFESPDEATLATVDSDKWKLRYLASYPQAIEKIQSCGISIYGSFILGFDSDGEEVFERLRDFVVRTGLLGFQILILTPIPGTRLYERLRAQGRLLQDRTWADYSTYRLNFRLARMDRERFAAGMLKLYRELYNDEAFERRKLRQMSLLRKRESHLPAREVASQG
jgi:radical SAM superfamily enzyme YgiQ (UPF0313 family)